MSDTLAACPGSNACVQGVCVEPCHGGEFPCPGGYECRPFDNKKYCVPTTCNDVECPPGASCKNGECTLDNAGGAGNAGGASSGEGGDSSMTSGGADNGEGGDQGSGTAGKTAGTAANGTGANGTGTPSADAHGKFGLVTGGGGCACRTVPSKNGHWAALAGLLALATVLTRRRRRSTRRAA